MRATLDRLHARQGDEGFTLIELLIVIVILGILAAIVVFSVSGIQNNAKKAACNSEVATVDTAEEAEIAQNGAAVASLAQLKTDGLIHSNTFTYVTGYDVANGKVTLVAAPPAGCTAN